MKGRTMTIVITVGNEKGGVGKTTVATNIAGILVGEYCNKVLFIDADSQGTATRALGLRNRADLYNWAVREDEPEGHWQQVLRPVTRGIYAQTGTTRGELLCLGSNAETRNIANSISSAAIFHRRLQQVADIFDYVVIDISPTPSLMHGAIYLATDYIVLPTLLEQWSIDGLRDTLKHTVEADMVRRTQGYGSVQVAGIIPNQFRPGRIVAGEALEHLQEKYDRVCSPLSDREVIRQAAVEGKLPYVYAPDSDSTKELYRMVEELMAVIE